MWVECAKTTPRENDISPLRFHACGCAFPCAVLRGRDVALRNVRLASARVPASMMLEFCLPVPVPVAIVRVAQGRFPVGILAFPLSISAQFPRNFNGGKGGILPNDGIRMDVLAFILQNSAFFRIPFCGILSPQCRIILHPTPSFCTYGADSFFSSYTQKSSICADVFLKWCRMCRRKLKKILKERDEPVRTSAKRAGKNGTSCPKMRRFHARNAAFLPLAGTVWSNSTCRLQKSHQSSEKGARQTERLIFIHDMV